MVSNENLRPLISCPGPLINWGIAKYVVVSRDERVQLFHLVHSWFLNNPSRSFFFNYSVFVREKNEQNGSLVIKIVWTILNCSFLFFRSFFNKTIVFYFSEQSLRSSSIGLFLWKLYHHSQKFCLLSNFSFVPNKICPSLVA